MSTGYQDPKYHEKDILTHFIFGATLLVVKVIREPNSEIYYGCRYFQGDYLSYSEFSEWEVIKIGDTSNQTLMSSMTAYSTKTSQ